MNRNGNDDYPVGLGTEPTPDPLDLLPAHVRKFFGLEHAPKPGAKARVDTPGPPPKPGERVSTDVLITRAARIAACSGRNQGGFWLACQLRDAPYSQGEAEGLYARYASQAGGTDTRGEASPYTEDEWQKSVRSAYSQSARTPWTKEGK